MQEILPWSKSEEVVGGRQVLLVLFFKHDLIFPLDQRTSLGKLFFGVQFSSGQVPFKTYTLRKFSGFSGLKCSQA